MKAFTKIVFRQVRNSLSRYLSIFAIIALGVGFFAGVRATAPDMTDSADAYYDSVRLADFRLLSTWGFSEQDVTALRQSLEEQGRDAELFTSQFSDLIVELGQNETVVSRVFSWSADQQYNVPTLKLGRLPESPDECLINYSPYAEDDIGCTVTLISDGDGEPDGFARTEYTIVGAVVSPLFISATEYGSTNIGDGSISRFLLLPAENFTADYYTELYIIYPELTSLSSYSDEYDALAEEICGELETISETLAYDRYSVEVASAESELADGERELADGRAELAENLEELESGRAELADAADTLAQAKAKIDDGQAELDASRSTLEQSRETLEQGGAALDEGEQALAAAQDELDSSRAQLESARSELDAGQAEYAAGLAQYQSGAEALSSAKEALQSGESEYSAGLSAYNTALAQYEQAVAVYGEAALAEQKAELDAAAVLLTQMREQLDSSREQIEANQAELDAAAAQLDAAKTELDSGEAEYAAGLKQYQSGVDALAARTEELAAKRAEWQSGMDQLADGERQLDQAQSALESARQEYEDGLAEYNNNLAAFEDGEKQAADAQLELENAQTELENGRQELAELEPPEWLVYDRNENPAYSEYNDNADRIRNIAKVFPVFFLAVAALVSLTTMTRMVDEERTQTGTLLALGYTNAHIVLKNMVYALSATLFGSVIGIVIGFQLFPRIIIACYGIMYSTGSALAPFRWSIALPSILAALGVVAVTVFGACYTDTRTLPATLMRPKSPPAGKRVLLERVGVLWRRLDFTSKVSVRNIARYKKRMIMTIVGVAGCTALMVAGFGLRDSISGIITTQYEKVWLYDALVVLDGGEDAVPDVVSAATAADPGAQSLAAFQKTCTAFGEEDSIEVSLLVAENCDIDPFIDLHERISDEKYSLPTSGDGAVITEKLAHMTGVKVGDRLRIGSSTGDDFEVTVTAIVENYISHYIYMSRECYETATGETFEPNCMLLNYTLDEDPESTLAENLLSDGALAVSLSRSMRSALDDVLGVFSIIIMVLIVSAGLLAFVVLYNLTNINITERIREIATLKVLGFYDREVSMYIFRENIVLTVAGSLIGLVLGWMLAMFVIETTEIDSIMFGRDISVLSYILSAGLTCLFSLAVSLAMHRRLRNVSMTESLKSVE